jgi:hypothetical protein
MKTFGLALLGTIGGYLIGFFGGMLLIETFSSKLTRQVGRGGDDRGFCFKSADGGGCRDRHAGFPFSSFLQPLAEGFSSKPTVWSVTRRS